MGIAAGAPLAISGVEAGERAISAMRRDQLGIMGTAKVALWTFLNSISTGFGMGDLVTNVNVSKTDGTGVGENVASSVPAGTWFKTSAAGGILIAWDIAVSWASRKFAKVNSGIRFLGTKLTGGK